MSKIVYDYTLCVFTPSIIHQCKWNNDSYQEFIMLFIMQLIDDLDPDIENVRKQPITCSFSFSH